MDENTIFQGASAAPPSPQTPPQQPVSVPPAAMPLQNVTPQPIGSGQPVPSPAPVSPAPVQPITMPPAAPPISVVQNQSIPSSGQIPPPPPPPVINRPAIPSSKSFPFGGIIKAVVGIIIVIVLAVLFYTVILPLFSNKNEKVTLTYWGLWEDPNVMQKVIDDFQKENPNIIVKYEKQDIKQQYRDRLITRISGGSGPDIFQFHNSWLSEMQTVLTPLPTDVIAPAEFRKVYYPVIVNDVMQNGAIYGIPLQIDTLALYTNTDMLQASSLEPPTNWEDFQKYAKSLTVKDENGKIKTAGAALGTYDNITHAPDILSLLFLQNGANIYDLSSTATQSTDTLNYYTQEYASGEGNVWDTSLDRSLLAFSKGNLAMYFGYSWDLFAIQAMNPNLHFQISPVPHLPLGRKITIASYWVEGVSQKSKHQKQAMLFMKFLAKKETLQKLFTEDAKVRSFGSIYPRMDLASSLKDNKLLAPFVNQANAAVSSFFVGDTYDNGLNERANNYLGDAVRSVLENTSAESALETLSSGVTQVLHDYGQ